jgi:hypothetical protein
LLHHGMVSVGSPYTQTRHFTLQIFVSISKSGMLELR